jgi:hypothetical protein
MTPADLSGRVLLAAAAMTPGSDSETTASMLYHSNWLPLTPRWLARFPDDAAVERYVVGSTATVAWLRTVDASWTHWRGGHGGPGSRDSRMATSFKVYVSVAPDTLPDAFARCVDVFAAQGTRAFKLSRSPRGLLRPDRMVAYCGSAAQTQQLVAALAQSLAGFAVHGVAFTATAPSNPAVSWARDPPAPAAAYGPSWRRWVCRKLAGYLHASDAPDAARRAASARARLRADGVNPVTWAPSDGLWPA